MGLCQNAERKADGGRSPSKSSNNQLREDIIFTINQLRDQHQVDELRESMELNSIAQSFSNQLAEKGNLEYSENQYNNEDLGEILFCCTGECTCDMIVDKWNEDGKNFKYKSKNPEASSFAQLVWKSSKLIGIGISQDSKGGTYVVANFYPAGNVQGLFAENVFPAEKNKKKIKKKDDKTNQNLAGFSEFCIDALKTHNKYRAKHKVPPLTLNKDLCKMAQKYAEKLSKTHSLNQSGEKYKGQELGENFFMCGGKEATGEMATSEWYSEIRNYNFRKDYQHGTGHFTQIIWKSTTDVGFGTASNKDGEYYVVGYYYPAGNFMGQFHENVPKA